MMARETKAQAKAREQGEALAMILMLGVRPGDVLHCILRSVSRSGMCRRIDVYARDKDGDLVYLSGYAAKALGRRVHPAGGVISDGCGMDMGFELVYSLSSLLFRDEDGKHCSEGAYALSHQWL